MLIATIVLSVCAVISTGPETCEAVLGGKLARRFGPNMQLNIRITADNARYIL